MGRKKIAIKRIEGDSQRKATFEKRRVGLLKKAMELSILCDCELSVTIKPRKSASIQNGYYIYSSDPYNKIIDNFHIYEGEYTLLTNQHINDIHPGKVSSRQIGHKITKTEHQNERKPTPFISIPMLVQTQNLRYIPTMNMQIENRYSPSFQQLCKGLNLPPQIDLPQIDLPSNSKPETNKKRSINMIENESESKEMKPPKKKIKIEDGNKVDIQKLIKTES